MLLLHGNILKTSNTALQKNLFWDQIILFLTHIIASFAYLREEIYQ